MTSSPDTQTPALLTWTKTGPRQYEAPYAGKTARIRGVDDLFFLEISSDEAPGGWKQIGYDHKLSGAKASVQRAQDKLDGVTR